MIKGVPIELQTAYDQQPENYLLLGLMADAADEAGELEVGECLRWLWRWKRVPYAFLSGACWYWPLQMKLKVSKELPDSLRNYCPEWTEKDSALRCIERVLEGFPQWKVQHSEEYHRLSVPPSTLTPQTTPS